MKLLLLYSISHLSAIGAANGQLAETIGLYKAFRPAADSEGRYCSADKAARKIYTGAQMKRTHCPSASRGWYTCIFRMIKMTQVQSNTSSLTLPIQPNGSLETKLEPLPLKRAEKSFYCMLFFWNFILGLKPKLANYEM